jgi:peptidyl-prolyl isomerase E (cyclophilin E)
MDAGPSEASRARRTLYVGGLEEAVTPQLLQAAFIPFGPLKDVQIPMDHAAST